MKKQNNIQSNRLFQFVAVLLLFVLISMHLLSGIFARYSALGRDDGSGRVAVFSVDASADSELLDMNVWEHTDGMDYSLTLRNDSEVSVSYTVTLKFTEPLPVGVTAQMNGQEAELSEDGKVLSFVDAGTLDVNTAGMAVLHFDVDWDRASASAQTDTMARDQLQIQSEFSTEIKFVQID